MDTTGKRSGTRNVVILASVFLVIGIFFWDDLGLSNPFSMGVDENESLANSLEAFQLEEGVTFESLSILDLALGSGEEATAGRAVSIHYVARLMDGQLLDTSYPAKTPISFRIGDGALIEGFERGIVGMKEGGLRRIVVPASMAYGKEGRMNEDGTYMVPPNSPIIFIVQLVSTH